MPRRACTLRCGSPSLAACHEARQSSAQHQTPSINSASKLIILLERCTEVTQRRDYCGRTATGPMPVMISRLVKGSQPDEVRKQRRLCAIYPFNDLAFLLINFRFEPRLCEPQSPFPGNGILPAETKAPERRLRFGMALGRDDARTRKPANSALFAMNGEISVCARLRGGAERTRTACQPRSRYRTNLRPGPIWRIFCDQMWLNCRRAPQKGLAISCKRSGTIGNSGRLGAL